MDGLKFEWDRRKETANRKKHGVSFAEAKTAFFDENARFMDDPDHSEEEDRFVLLGLSSQLRLLVVSIAIGKIRMPYESSQPVRQIALSDVNTRALEMRDKYDFSKSKKNPYATKLKKQITIRLDEETIAYFKALAEQKGIPYQNLINLYLRDCAEQGRDLKIKWA